MASGNVTVSGSGTVLTIKPGTVVAHDINRSSGAGKLIVGAGSSLVCAGKPFDEGYITWVNCDRIQWAMAGCIPYGDMAGFVELNSGSHYNISFTKWFGLGCGVIAYEGGGTIRDCIFHEPHRPNYENCTIARCRNCLFTNNSMGLRDFQGSGTEVTFFAHNCLVFPSPAVQQPALRSVIAFFMIMFSSTPTVDMAFLTGTSWRHSITVTMPFSYMTVICLTITRFTTT